MEQIYYTQCPIGYGLGASNGFQIKRLGEGYPPSGDVRHLALRAFLPGSNGKQLAPGTLRYRRVGTVAEVAWLEPRAREYETERGQWGRPGGHFAHGLRLDPEEFEAIACWPAGLYGRPCWRRSDPEPSRGRRPDDLAIDADALTHPPDFASVAPAVDLDQRTLAHLLARAAEAVRTGRSLILIDEPDRLGPRIAALTFAFPSALRSELTFSTYHDRPEELSGFRIHGMAPSPSTHRSLIAGLGPIVDLTTDRDDPTGPLPPWAEAISTWLTRREPRDEEDWTRADARSRVARRPDSPEQLWSDAWLDGLIGLAAASRPALPHPSTEKQWLAFARQLSWTAQAGLLGELADPLTPAWWRPIAREASREPAVRDAFWTLVLSPSIAEHGAAAEASSWGAIAAYFWVRDPSVHREQRLNAILRKIGPADRLARFLDGLIRAVPAEVGQAALAWIERRDSVDPRALLPLRARNAVGLFAQKRRADALERVLRQVAAFRDILPIVLDLIADESARLGESDRVAAVVASALEGADTPSRIDFERWALRRRERGRDDWIAPALTRIFATDLLRSEWEALRDRTEPALRPALADACLASAGGPGAADDAFPWAVESLLLGIPEPDQDQLISWAEPYLDGVGSSLDLADRRRRLGPALDRWLASARSSCPFRPESAALLDDAEAIVHMIEGRGGGPDEATLARVPTRDRPPMLGLLIEHLASGEFDPSRPILDRCARAWPGAFAPNAPERDRFARPLAELLLQFLPDPGLWIDSLGALLDAIGAERDDPSNLRIGGIAGPIVAETCRLTVDSEAAWSLRSALLLDDRLHAALGDDLARDLRHEPPKRAIDVARRWTLALDLGIHTSRFFEVLLNASDGPRLSLIVPEYAAELWTLEALPWWAGPAEAGPEPDLREAFARLIPMAPLPNLRSRSYVEAWLYRTKPEASFRSVREDPDMPIPPDPDPLGDRRATETAAPITDRSRARWECVLALTGFHWEGKSAEVRWSEVLRWRKNEGSETPPPAPMLDPDDRLAFLGWLVLGLDHPGTDAYTLEMMARWIAKDLGLRSRARVAECLEPIAAQGVRIEPEHRKLANDLAHQVGLQVEQ